MVVLPGDWHTKLCPLELLEVLMRAEETLHGLDTLLLPESREVIEVAERLCEDPE